MIGFATMVGIVRTNEGVYEGWYPYQWMVYNGKSKNKMDDSGVPFLGNLQIGKYPPKTRLSDNMISCVNFTASPHGPMLWLYVGLW